MAAGSKVFTSVCVVLALFFLMAGGTKLAGMEPHPQHFAEWGYPQWFRLVVGAFEVTAAGLLLWPAGRLYGSLIVVVIMVGAIFTHLTHAQTTQALLPVGIILVGGWIARRLITAPRTA